MGHLLTRTQIQRLVAKHGREVIEHRHMQIERCCYQHGNVTTFEHSVRVACLAVWMADRAHLWYRVDLKSLIRASGVGLHSGVKVNMVFDPPWNRSMMSEAALLSLGL